MTRILGANLAIVVVFVSSAMAQFATNNVTFIDQIPISQLGGGNNGADIWGWTDPQTGREYALMTSSTVTSFVDVTDPYDAQYLGYLPNPTNANSLWRDVKTFNNHAYIVADGDVGPHGLQVFDLTQLRGVNSPQVFSSTSVNTTFRNAHNVVINEGSGYAYAVGTNLDGGRAVAFNLNNSPGNPQFESIIDVDGYIHDAQVVNYTGPDPDHQGREIMFSASVNDFVIIDVTDKQNPFRIWEDTYDNAGYIHQGWLSEDQRTFYMNDEADSRWTHKWDVTDVDNPTYLGSINDLGSVIDHNLYVKGKYVYQANYTAGVRIFEITDPQGTAANDLDEVAWIDTYPDSNSGSFQGAWSVYPFFESGTIISSDMNRGLFIFRNDTVPSDFDGDGYADCADINQLTSAIAAGSEQSWFDLNDDGDVNLEDRDAWLAQAATENGLGGPYLVGDMNLDGVVDGSDFITWNDNKFTANDHWCSGDVNADGFVDGSDFIEWNGNKFQSSDAATVPEPSSLALLASIAMLVGLGSRSLSTKP